MLPILVFSHLRWQFVYQRPQHLLARLAARRPVLFFEEPITGAERPWLAHARTPEGVTVLRPHVCGQAAGFDDAHLPVLRRMVQEVVQDPALGAHLLWFYTPMALGLAAELRPRGVVYDCMDELSAFAGAPPQMLERESALLQLADVVLAGGRSLYEAKRERHAEVHCLPSSVDAAHFAKQPPEHASQAALPHPRLGYYGVIDERLDLDLVAALADAHSDWQVVMVGPVVKIDPASLPHRPNLHWLGARSYAELPAHLVGWDVALLPFALNASTRFISPTKTLEYLAAGRPCVSTRIRDVAREYGPEVAIADGPAAFVAACERILTWSAAQRAAFAAAARARVAATSWDRQVERIEALLARFEPGHGTGAAGAAPALAA
ncbi:glycosyl transferase [Pseudorhodoferax aquiterrae]|uniref:Glycosyl transferase n=1 Tax=Pseudorhodoferax aquiterrae TaxID=747304 RepID=A0ABQ3G6P1_9BURK|nr:glycosyltransferase [Pseudorhodoferax aquiterrae]GHC91950.1 glycosyl transferase [Pseudorhodoferax aquiterrae]